MKVCELIIRNGNCWDTGKIRRLFSQESAEAILHIRLPTEDLADSFFLAH